MKRPLLAFTAVLAMATANLAMATDAAPPERNDEAGAWAGVWRLDRNASDPIEPLLEVMKVPWIARKISNLMRPKLIITALPSGGLRMRNENPIHTSEQALPADGEFRERIDPLDRKVETKASWNAAGQLVVTERTRLGEDRVVVVTSTWTRRGDVLEREYDVEADDGRLVIRRVFRREH